MTKPILVVDDDPHMTQAVSAILRRHGFTVQTAANGREALEAIAHVEPALVLLDLQMPVLDGRGFVQAVRESEIRVPVVIMSADPDVWWVARELEVAGALAKPFDLRQLLSMVETKITV